MEKKTDPRIEKLRAMQEQALQGGGADRIEGQHKKGKMTARERIEALLDAGTFQEIQAFAITPNAEDALTRHGVSGHRIGEIDGTHHLHYARTLRYGRFVALQNANKICRDGHWRWAAGSHRLTVGSAGHGLGRRQLAARLRGVFREMRWLLRRDRRVSVMVVHARGGGLLQSRLTGFLHHDG